MRRAVMRAFSAFNVWVYRLSGGRVLARTPSGAPVFLLTTKGRKSGQRRTVPLLYFEEGGDFIIVGSQGSTPRRPGWYLNLRNDPAGVVEIGRQRMPVTAQPVSEDERDRLWPRLVALYPPYETYRHRATRTIPILRLSPVPS